MKSVRSRIRKESFKTAYSFAAKWFFGSIAVSGFTFFAAHTIFQVPLVYSILIGIFLLILAFFIRYTVCYAKFYRYEKKRLNWDNVYGDAILILRDAFAAIHELRKVADPTPQQLMNTLTFVCGKLKEIFDKKTKNLCSICIKVITDDSKIGVETELVTLCRDPKTSNIKKRTIVDKHPDVHHNVFQNTCFLHFFNFIGQDRGKYYLNNCLPDDAGYLNTSFQVHGEIPIDANTPELRNREWTLPYKSEIVVPICPLNHIHNVNKPLLYGFICVDSMATHIFNENYDTGMLQGVADGIFDIIHLYVEKRKQAQAHYLPI